MFNDGIKIDRTRSSPPVIFLDWLGLPKLKSPGFNDTGKRVLLAIVYGFLHPSIKNSGESVYFDRLRRALRIPIQLDGVGLFRSV